MSAESGLPEVDERESREGEKSIVYDIHISFNELPFKEDYVAASCRSELERLAEEIPGFLEFVPEMVDGPIPPHCFARFEGDTGAFSYASVALSRNYVAEVAVSPEIPGKGKPCGLRLPYTHPKDDDAED